jgi:hypothetical protein
MVSPPTRTFDRLLTLSPAHPPREITENGSFQIVPIGRFDIDDSREGRIERRENPDAGELSGFPVVR